MASKTIEPIVDSLTKVPTFDINKTRNYFNKYGDFATDDAYRDWAKSKQRQLNQKVSVKDQYLNDDEFLKYVWDIYYNDIINDDILGTNS